MNILVINSGSSSIKFSLFDSSAGELPKCVLDGELSGIGTADATLGWHQTGSAGPASVKAGTASEAIGLVLDAVSKPEVPAIHAVGYRVVHPGPKLHDHQRITPEVLSDLEHAIAFAPLHAPGAIELIRDAMARFPELPHYACFDTIFHQTMPPVATTYPIPLRYLDQGVHRYGFHGLSCESVVFQFGAAGIQPKRMIIAHLGSGCSVTALRDGQSVDTTMGLTPTGGVVMGTRPGDLDPGLIFYLLREPAATVDSVEQMLNHEAGLKALFGVNDMRKLREAAVSDAKARLAVDIFIASVRKVIGGFAAVYGADVLVFTGGIGEHDPETRWALGRQLCGDQPQIEQALNEAPLQGFRKISREKSRVEVYVAPAQEDLMIARHVARMSGCGQ